jgi:hypothetical protein
MLKANIFHPVYYTTSSGGQIDRASARQDTSIIIVEAHGQDGDRSWNVRETVRPGESYLGHDFEELADLIAEGKSAVEL